MPQIDSIQQQSLPHADTLNVETCLSLSKKYQDIEPSSEVSRLLKHCDSMNSARKEPLTSSTSLTDQKDNQTKINPYEGMSGHGPNKVNHAKFIRKHTTNRKDSWR